MGSRKIKRKVRQVPITPEVRDVLEQQIQKFREKFGREPGPDDPVFFDPDGSEPQAFDLGRVQAELTDAMARASIDPAKIYAYHRTGLIVTRDNYHLLSEEARREWQAALDEYAEKMKGRLF